MPAVSPKQQKLFAIALDIKRGKLPRSYSKEAARLAESLPEAKLREYAKLPIKRKKKKRK